MDERSAIKKGVRPPVIVPEGLTQGDMRDYPGGVTLYTPMCDKVPAVTPLYYVQFDHKSVAGKRLELNAHLEDIFYVNMFKMWTTNLRANKTATENRAQEEEKMYMLGTLIERQISEMLNPIITRIFWIMDRAGMFPQPPEELSDREIKIEYMSVLANIQKQASFSGIQTLTGIAGQLGQMQIGLTGKSDVLDNIDCE